MKKTIFVLSVLGLYSNLHSQQTEPIEKKNEKLNILKSNVTGLLAYRNLNVTYERALKSWFSVTGGVNFIPKGSTPQARHLKDLEFDYNQVKLSGFAFTLESRFYLGKGYGKGFYLAPYYRYSNFNLSEITLDIEENNESFPVNIHGSTNANSVGLMIGSQWFLGANKNWVLDWWILGAHYGSAKGNMTAKTTNRTLTEEEQAQLKNEIQSKDLPLEYTITTNPNGAVFSLYGPWLGIRGGLSVGYRF
ncbi:DUF3575 domain-containing protein [Bergeyella sp. RCAD1439]|uniref:DUF3575 domain-containing protein n=1 Tax=Bergeyella anatis TaxID=3113737 RepID=UPI002E19C196|nr:DUF3575 domain-containing protein [Bergeyella sp. RCAD1439]